MKVLMVTSSGGVATDLLALAEPLRSLGATIRWVASRHVDTESLLAAEPVTWFDAEADLSSIRPMAAAYRSAVRDLRSDRPDLLLSAGTAIAVPWFVAARRVSVPSIWVETFNIVAEQGRVAQLCDRLAQKTLVQDPDRLAARPAAVSLGALY